MMSCSLAIYAVNIKRRSRKWHFEAMTVCMRKADSPLQQFELLVSTGRWLIVQTNCLSMFELM